jgi:O-antigen/teichoic acid export membrane protein
MGFLAMFRVARHLAPEGYGQYALVLSTASFFGLIAFAGLSQVIVTEIAKDEKATGKYFTSAARIRFVSTIVSIALLVAYYLFVKNEHSAIIYAVTCVLMVNSSFADILESLAFGRQRMQYSSYLNIGVTTLWVVGLYIMPLDFLTIDVVLVFYTTIQIFRSLSYYLIEYKNKFFEKRLEARSPVEGYLIRMGLPYLWMNLLGMVSIQIPILLLGLWKGSEEVGLYGAGNRMAVPISLLLNAMARAIFPKLVSMRRSDENKFVTSVYEYLSLVIFVGGISSLLLLALSQEVVSITVGLKYLPAVPTFKNQIVLIFLYSIFIVIGSTLSAMEKQRTLSVLATINGIVSFAFVYYGAQKGGYVLSAALVISYCIGLVYHFYVLGKILKVKQEMSKVVRNTLMICSVLFFLTINVDGIWQRVGIALLASGIWFPFFLPEIRSMLTKVFGASAGPEVAFGER